MARMPTMTALRSTASLPNLPALIDTIPAATFYFLMKR
jgi:hypothetical protein